MPRSVDVAISDMLKAISHIEEATQGVDHAAFANDWRLKYIVERGLEIVSEASRGLPEPIRQEHRHIKWAGVRDIGNVLRHQYASVSTKLIWNVVQDELPKLRLALEAMRDRASD